MIKKIFDFLAGVPMTIAGGLFLAASLVLMLTGTEVPVNPAWVTTLICGTPLLYLAIWRLFNNKGISKISSALLISIAMIAAIAIGDIFAAGEVAFIMSIGAILEDKTAQRAKKGLKKLISLAPQQGRRITGGKEEMVKAEEIRKGVSANADGEDIHCGNAKWLAESNVGFDDAVSDALQQLREEAKARLIFPASAPTPR